MTQEYGHIPVKRDDGGAYADMEWKMMIETRKPTNHSFLAHEDGAMKLGRLDCQVERLDPPVPIGNRICSCLSAYKILWYLHIIALLGVGMFTEFMAITDLQQANQYTHELMENCALPAEEVPSSVSPINFNLAIFRVVLGVALSVLGIYKGWHY